MSDKKKEIKVVAQYRLSSSAGEEVVRTHEAAWVRLHELPRPARAQMIGWVRKDEK
jgi:hypothetical protein